MHGLGCVEEYKWAMEPVLGERKEGQVSTVSRVGNYQGLIIV